MKIIFTGGGTAGHVMVNRILIPFLQRKDPDCNIAYIGSHKGMERQMISELSNVPFYGISTGKLRRYFSLKNVLDVFRVIKGFFDSIKILKEERPQLIYSGGGYVVVPVVWAARCLRIPVLLRETDFTVGLANRLCMPYAKEMFVTFPDTQQKIQSVTSSFPGMIVRPELFDSHSRFELNISDNKPICLVIGGSQGAMRINRIIWESLPSLKKSYTVLHICGRGNKNAMYPDTEHYRQIEFTDEIGMYLNLADVVITRSGSNATIEGLSLGKRMVCIPIPGRSSRGEQELNAEFAVLHGNAVLLRESKLTEETLLCSIQTARMKHNVSSYQVTKYQMEERICHHVNTIWRHAFEQFERDLIMQAKGDDRVNSQEL